MKLFLKILILLVCYFTAPWLHAQGQLNIVYQGKSSYVITLPAKPSVHEIEAAKVLQTQLYNITNCRLPIKQQQGKVYTKKILIGQSALLTAADTGGIDPDGIIIKVKDDNLVLSGGPGKGTLYSVYTFLEKYLAAEYLSKDQFKIVKKNSLQVPQKLYIRQEPSFNYRMQFFPDAFDSSYCDGRKINYVFDEWGLWVHSFEGLVPPNKYFKTHPEYYSLVDGKRNPAQLCLTNPDVLKIVVAHLEQIIPNKPQAKYWSVSQNDNPHYCNCDACQRINDLQESPSGSLLAFVNDVATHFPGKIITTLAYGYSEKPPKTIRPASNVLIMLTTASVVNRNIPLAKQPNEPFNANLVKWAAITKELMVWDYLVKFANLLLPFPNMQVYQPDMQYYASKGVRYLFMQGPGKTNTSFSELKGYLVSKLMWNVNGNVDEYLQQFISAYYGPVGGKYVQQYFQAMSGEAKSRRSSMLVFQRYDTTIFKTYLSPVNVQRYQEIFRQAFKKIPINSLYGKRLAKEYAALLYTQLESDMWEMGNGKTLSKWEAKQFQKRLDDWKTSTIPGGIIKLSESGITVDDYYRHYQNAIKNQQK